LQEIQGI